MFDEKSKSTFYAGLLKLAGFVLIIALGYVSAMALVTGILLYIAGALIVFRFSSVAQIEKAALFGVILLLANLAFFSTLEITALLDISLAVYVLILSDLALLMWRKRQMEQASFQLPYKFLVAFLLLSIVLSTVSARSVKDVAYYFVIYVFAFVLFYSCINLFSNRQSIVSIIKAAVSISFISAIVAVWQLYSSSFKSFYYLFIHSRDQEILELWEVVSRVVGTWQHPSYLGIMLALSIPLGLYLLFYESKSSWWKAFLVTALVIVSSVLLLTNTRSSVISAAIGVIFLFIYSRKSRGRLLPRTREFAALGLIAAAALLLYQFVFVAEIYTKPQAWRVDASATIWGRFLRSDRMSTESLVQRSQLYALAWDEFKGHPITGMGAKNFPYVVEGLFERGTDAHNIFLQTLAETGFLGFLALLFLYGKLFIDVGRHGKDDSDEKLKAALAAVLVVIAFDSLFNNPLYSLRILAIFWLISSALFVIRKIPKSENAQIAN